MCPGGSGSTPLVIQPVYTNGEVKAVAALALQQQQQQQQQPPQPLQQLQQQTQVTQCRSGASTPVKSKFAGRRVSDLLKERRGYGPQDEIVPFVHDRRPVSQLLKESRQRQAQMLAAGNSHAASSNQSSSWSHDAKKQMSPGLGKRQNNNELLLQALRSRSKSVTGELMQSATPQSQPANSGAVRTVSSTSSSPTDQQLASSIAAALQQHLQEQQQQQQQQQLQQQLQQNGPPVLQRAHSEPAFEGDLQALDGGQLAALLMRLKRDRQQQTAPEATQPLPASDSPEVNVSNLERDAEQDSFKRESASDLADITPSNFDMVASQDVETGTEQQGAELGQGLAEQQPMFGGLDLKDDDDSITQIGPDFFSPPKVQRNAGSSLAGMCFPFISGFQGAVNDTSDLMSHFRTHTTTLGGTAGFGGSRSVGQSPINVYQGSVGSSPTPMPSPASSHRSAASTPMSMLSPQSNQFQLVGSSTDNAFTPIQQTSTASVSMVSPVKPMATVASGPPLVGLASAVNTQTLTTSLQPSDVAGGGSSSLVMSSQASNTWTVPSNPRPTAASVFATLKQKRFLQPAPAASTLATLLSGKPSKRSRTQSSGQGSSKRMRHHSAQSSFNSLRNSGGNTCGLTMGHHPQQQLLQAGPNTLSPSTHLQQHQPQRQSLTAGPVPPQTFNQEPESPFSPEISEIMNGANSNNSIQCALNALNTQSLRSHSVPVQNMFSTCQESQDQEMFQNTLSSLAAERSHTGGTTRDFLQNMPATDELGNLLQDKLQDGGMSPERGIQMGCNVNYNARKNLTELLETRGNSGGATSTGAYSGGYSRGDHMISGASVRTTLPRMALNNDVNTEAGSECFVGKMPAVGAAYPSHSVPTPPSSHNASPDFSSEMAGMMEQGTPYGLNRAAVPGVATSAMDTPNSLDTVAPPEGKENLTESLFAGMYEAATESAPALENTQQMSFW